MENLLLKIFQKIAWMFFKTHGDNKRIKKTLKFNKFTSFEKGFSNTYEWYKKYYKKLIN